MRCWFSGGWSFKDAFDVYSEMSSSSSLHPLVHVLAYARTKFSGHVIAKSELTFCEAQLVAIR